MSYCLSPECTAKYPYRVFKLCPICGSNCQPFPKTPWSPKLDYPELLNHPIPENALPLAQCEKCDLKTYTTDGIFYFVGNKKLPLGVGKICKVCYNEIENRRIRNNKTVIHTEKIHENICKKCGKIRNGRAGMNLFSFHHFLYIDAEPMLSVLKILPEYLAPHWEFTIELCPICHNVENRNREQFELKINQILVGKHLVFDILTPEQIKVDLSTVIERWIAHYKTMEGLKA